jgi:alpha-tubulin suppressor-like RCC1 family protein
LKIEALSFKNPKDIFCGGMHSFVIVGEERLLYGFGLNRNGQLGDGTMEDSYLPRRPVGKLRTKSIRTVSGGARHTIVITTEGKVYSFGVNDSGQLGIGDTCTQFMNELNNKLHEQMQKDTNELSEITVLLTKLKQDKADKKLIKAQERILKLTEQKISQRKDVDKDGILYFQTP